MLSINDANFMVSIAFTGGGTGGHIYPGLAIVAQVKKLFPCRIFWIGSASGMDRGIVEAAGIEFFGIPSGKLRRYFSLRNITDLFRVAAGFFAAKRLLKREAPGLLFSKGGFVSVPPCAAAKLLGIPVFTHESDFSPGLANRINTRFAERIFVSYAESASFFKGAARRKLCVSGNPVRPDFESADPAKGRAFLGLGSDERVLLVLGGSLGSREINELVIACLPELSAYYTVVHQTGESAEGIPEASPRYKPFAYLREELCHVLAAAELVLCRSGANTIWECKSLRKPMLLIPLRGAGTRGDQVENARLFERRGAALCFMPEAAPLAAPLAAHGGANAATAAPSATEVSAAKKLAGLIKSLADDPQKRKQMAEAELAAGGYNGETSPAAFIAEEIIKRLKE